MQWIGSYVIQKVRVGDRRVKVVVMVGVLGVVWVMTSFLHPTLTHRLFPPPASTPTGALNTTGPTQKQPLISQPTQDHWWDKLLRLEHNMRQINYKCQDSRWMGNRHVCFDFNLVPRHNCTVYSFGIDYKFDFDDAMANYGCTVFSFDPSMKVEDHKRGERVYFKRLGLAGKDSNSFVPRLDGYVKARTTWPMRRLTSIMKDLGHAEGSLTIVKIDIESYEWDVMMDLVSQEDLLASIPQIFIEWHLFSDFPPRARYDDFLTLYATFQARGFHSFHWNSEGEDHNRDHMRTQTETSWVNERFLKPSKS
ncbi:hypothetical protein ACOMHN_006384 [Nucella lapillus]